MKKMKWIYTVVAVGLMSGALPAASQPLWNSELESLSEIAEEMVEVKLDGRMLDLAVRFLSADQPDEREIRDIVSDLEGIYVYSFTFDRDWMYDKAIAERVRGRVGSGWERMVRVRSRKSENVDVWLRPGTRGIDGIFIVSAEPREFTVVHLVGTIDIEKLSKLEGQFGIPKLSLDGGRTVEKRVNR